MMDSNISKTKTYICKACGIEAYCRYNSKNIYCSRKCSAVDMSDIKREQYKTDEAIRKKLSKTWIKKGEKLSPDTQFKKGFSNLNWNNGSSFERQGFGNAKYMAWRKQVIERDGNICQVCQEETDKIETDHIKPWAIYPELRFEVDNGQVICRPCHLLKSVEDRRIIALAKGN